MSQLIASMIGKRILAESARNKFGQEVSEGVRQSIACLVANIIAVIQDPYFEEVPASRLGRAFGKKTRKRRKAIPPGLSEHDAKILTQVKRRAYRLDYALFNLCGVRFGWSSVIGIVPL